MALSCACWKQVFRISSHHLRSLCVREFATTSVRQLPRPSLLSHCRLALLETRSHLIGLNKNKPTVFSRFLAQRGFRTKRSMESTKPEVEMVTNGNGAEKTSLLKPFVFTVGVCSCSFFAAMIWNYERMRMIYKNMQSRKKDSGLRNHSKEKTFGFRQHLNSMWGKISSGQKLVVGIIAANLGVLMLWRVPFLQPTLIRYFTSAANHPLPSLVLSSFSHISILHFFINMYVLWSFASVTVNLFGTEQFTAVYLSAGTVSAFTSITCQKLLKRPRVVSLGASGAIMALLGIVGMAFPDGQLSIAFVSEIFPHSFSAENGVKALIAFDVIGLLLGWRMLDHAGHLGGMLFGILYAKYGSKGIWGNREGVLKWWHQVRGKP